MSSEQAATDEEATMDDEVTTTGTDQVTFADAVFNDPDMTPEQKIHWLHVTCVDYLEKLEAAERERDALQQAVIAYCTTRYSATYDTLGKVLLEQGVKLPYWDALTHPAPSSKEDT